MIQISIEKKGLRADLVSKLVSELILTKWPDARVQVLRREPAESRSERFDEAMSLVEDAAQRAEELRDELQDWLGSLPENLQQTEKAGMLTEAIDQLETFNSNCQEATAITVDFPGMF